MNVFSVPLTNEEARSCVEDGSLTVILRLPFSEIVESCSIDGFNDLIDDYIPSFILSDLCYEVVGYSRKDDLEGEGYVHVKVNGKLDLDEIEED